MAFPLDIALVKRAEAKLSRQLPPGYIAKMCRSNGGEIAAGGDCWALFPIFDDSDRNRLKRTCNDVIRETEVARQWTGFPEDAIAIGSNGTGDKLVFLTDPASNRYADSVYVWDHETGDLERVADAFEELSPP